MIEDFYKTKQDPYFSGVRSELLPFFEGKNKKILDVGCGTGAILRELKRLGIAKEIVGVEIHKESAKAAEKFLDKVFVGNVEELTLPYKNYFDYIILADVIEHTSDPWETVNRAVGYLKKDGYLILSIPNIRNWRIFREVFLKGSFEYKEAGVMDRGHLRFFTKKSIEKLLSCLDFRVVDLRINVAFDNRKQDWLNRLMFGQLGRLFIEQYLVKATRKKK
ncbi:MAG: class I SAM-dependent methyltransferase [Patescibacteria group bacterium]|nr:class I SAM-dependent methyltransferase [Patescibacteria group bacterium]